MRSFLAVALFVVSASAQRIHQQEVYGPPSPYQYGYSTQDVDGTSSAEESSDGNGRVTGKYSIALGDGRQRTVSYWADETGFHADVVTNELGTESKDPADVTIRSSAPTGPEAAFAFESQRLKARSSFVDPVYLPAPAAQGFAALRPVRGRFYRKRA